MTPGRDVSDSELIELQLRGQLAELRDLALFSDAQEARDLEKGASKLRSILIDEGSVDREDELVDDLAGELDTLRNQRRLTGDRIRPVVSLIAPRIPAGERQALGLDTYVPPPGG